MNLPLTVMHNASVKCLSNAEAFIEDAKALISRGSYGHAVALLVLAEEELGKSFLWQMRILGVEIPESLLRSHTAKQLVKFSFLDFMEIFILDILDAVIAVYREPDIEKQEELAQSLLRRLEEFDESEASALKARLEADFSRLAEVNQLKMEGLYVDVLPGGTILSPLRFSEHDAQEQLKIVEGRYRRFSKVFAMPKEVAEDKMTEDQLLEQRKFWEEHKEVLEENMARFLSMLESWARRR